jgi:hypothetical protein
MNPNEVVIRYDLNIDQVNTILEGLGQLPFNRVDQLVGGIRSIALNTLREAEMAAQVEAQAAANQSEEGAQV